MGEKIVLKETSPLRGALLEGPSYEAFSDDAFRQVYERLESWLARRELTPTRWIAHFYDAPDEAPEGGRTEACIAFEGEASPSEGVRVEELPVERVASLTTTLDRADDPEAVYEKIYAWLEEQKLEAMGPAYVREIYDVNPWMGPEEETHVEFQVPVQDAD